MKNITLSIALSLVLSSLSYLQADVVAGESSSETSTAVEKKNPFYVGVGYGYLSSNRTATISDATSAKDGQVVRDTDSTANNLLLQVGFRFNPYFAIEGRYTTSIGDHALVHNHKYGTKEDVKIDISNTAIYLKPSYPIKDFSIYALIGYGQIVRHHKVAYHTWDGEGFEWGLGVQYTMIEQLAVFVDYTSWYDESGEAHAALPRKIDTQFATVNIGLTYLF